VGNLEANGTVKEDDSEVLLDVNEGHELTHDELFIFGKFLCLVQVGKKYCCFVSSKCDGPLIMSFDCFVCLRPNSNMVDGDIDISD